MYKWINSLLQRPVLSRWISTGTECSSHRGSLLDVLWTARIGKSLTKKPEEVVVKHRTVQPVDALEFYIVRELKSYWVTYFGA